MAALCAKKETRHTSAGRLLTAAHDAGGLALFHAHLEARQIAVDKVLLRHVDIDVIAVGAIPAVELVGYEVLAARRRLQRVTAGGRGPGAQSWG
jgi:hypothetical protein